MKNLSLTFGLVALLGLMFTPNVCAQSWKKLYREAQILADSAKYAEAIPIYEKALTKVKEKKGEASKEYIQTLNELGQAHKQKRDFTAAKPLLEKCWSLAKTTLDTNSIAFASIANNLGEVYYATGSPQKSLNLFEKATEIARKDKKYQKEYVNYARNCCTVLSKIGEFDKARNLYDEILTIDAQIYGKESIEYSKTLNGLGVLNVRSAQYLRAKDNFEEAVRIRQKLLGEKSELYINSLSNLATVYTRMGDYIKAEKLYNIDLRVTEEVSGRASDNFATSLSNLALIYTYNQKYYKAEVMLKEALEIRKQTRGEQSAHYLMTLFKLSELYQNMGNYRQAINLAKEALATVETSLGKNIIITLCFSIV